MAASDIPATQHTLIGRLADLADKSAWDEFVTRYGCVLRRWCKRWGLQEADSEDVVQNILLELARYIHRYSPSGRFRVWLKTIAQRAWYDYAIKRKHRERGSGNSDVLRVLNLVEAEEDFLAHLDAEAELELLQLAMSRVRGLVSESTWRAFELLSLEQRSGASVAEELGITTGSVYVANCRVKKLVNEEVHRLDSPEPV